MSSVEESCTYHTILLHHGWHRPASLLWFLIFRFVLTLQFLPCKSRNQKYDTITFITCCTAVHAHIPPPFILFVHPHSSRLQIWRQDRTVLKIHFLRSVTPCSWVNSCRHFEVRRAFETWRRTAYRTIQCTIWIFSQTQPTFASSQQITLAGGTELACRNAL